MMPNSPMPRKIFLPNLSGSKGRKWHGSLTRCGVRMASQSAGKAYPQAKTASMSACRWTSNRINCSGVTGSACVTTCHAVSGFEGLRLELDRQSSYDLAWLRGASVA